LNNEKDIFVLFIFCVVWSEGSKKNDAHLLVLSHKCKKIHLKINKKKDMKIAKINNVYVLIIV